MNFIFVYITNPTKGEARKIAQHLLRKRLIGCANIFPVESLYWWNDKIKRAGEFVLIAKTKKDNFEKIKREVEKIHSYSVPCVAKITASFNKEYADWLNKVIK